MQRDINAAINILNKALGPRDDVSRPPSGAAKPPRRVGIPSKTATGGHPESNAQGVATSTLLGANLAEQVATVN